MSKRTQRRWAWGALLGIFTSAVGVLGGGEARAESPFRNYLEVAVQGGTVGGALALACPDAPPASATKGVHAADSPERTVCLERRRNPNHPINRARFDAIHRFFTTDYQSALIRFFIALGLEDYPALSALGKIEQLSLAVSSLLTKLQNTTLKNLHDNIPIKTHFWSPATGSRAPAAATSPFIVEMRIAGINLEFNVLSFERGDALLAVNAPEDSSRLMFAAFYALGMEAVRQILWDPSRPGGTPIVDEVSWFADVQAAVGISKDGAVISGKNKFVQRFAELAQMVPYQNRPINPQVAEDLKRIEDYVIAWAADESGWTVDVTDPFFVGKFVKPVLDAQRVADASDTSERAMDLYARTSEIERNRLAAISFYSGILKSGVGNAYKEILGRSQTLYQQSWASVAAQGVVGVVQLGKAVASQVAP